MNQGGRRPRAPTSILSYYNCVCVCVSTLNKTYEIKNMLLLGISWWTNWELGEPFTNLVKMV
jgi:hypothetical protein